MSIWCVDLLVWIMTILYYTLGLQQTIVRAIMCHYICQSLFPPCLFMSIYWKLIAPPAGSAFSEGSKLQLIIVLCVSRWNMCLRVFPFLSELNYMSASKTVMRVRKQDRLTHFTVSHTQTPGLNASLVLILIKLVCVNSIISTFSLSFNRGHRVYLQLVQWYLP